jgi:uracil-DNA glycosylase
MSQQPINELDFGDSTESENEVKDETRQAIKKFCQSLAKEKITEDKILDLKNTIMLSNDQNDYIKYLTVNVQHYNYKTWEQCYPDCKVYLKPLLINKSWLKFINQTSGKPYFRELEIKLSSYLYEKVNISPRPQLIFNAFNTLSLDKVKVVILGQDPYFGQQKIDKAMIPQACGYSFSVPYGYPKPPSLSNIYKNLQVNGHIKDIPKTGCLLGWILQGCLMINAALTTTIGIAGAHQGSWKQFAKDLIDYLNHSCQNIVFVAWGAKAFEICQNIDRNRHCLIVSSHPSGLSATKGMSAYCHVEKRKIDYPSFMEVDHFGRINTYLKSKGKHKIFWNLLEF